MTEPQWQVLTIVSGSGKAEILKGLLQAQEIDVVLSQEGLGDSVYPVSIGPLSEIQVLVRTHQLDAARQVLADFDLEEYNFLEEEDEAADSLDLDEAGD